MKYILFLLLISTSGCLFDTSFNPKEIANKKLKNNSFIRLYFNGGGATAPDVIWVEKDTRDSKCYISKIKWSNTEGDEINIYEINDTLIKIRITDTSIWKGSFREFSISTNNKLEPNDGSMYADSTY